ncbi:aminoglycoside phosphotransferase family protein [Nocardioides psychrotolerans]|uniref:phosphotransferase family protein n=1 Tax=Nocardioides psychrotolerans TaxID=1005945 RepID=UPI00313848F5
MAHLSDTARSWVEGRVGPVEDVRELQGGWTSTMLALTPEGGDEVVLRLMTEEPWRTHGAALTTREAEVQRMLAPTPVPAPRSLALDAEGEHGGVAAHLMTLVPGEVDVDRVDAASLERLADVLAAIHDVEPTIEVRDYQSWAWEAKHVVPPWASDAGLWEAAFALLRTDPPSYEPRLIHRDFHHRNVLWVGDEVGGVVDWVETSLGPAWLDVAHGCSNIALHHGTDAAQAFADAYVARTGRAPQPFFDVMDVVGFLPPPGRRSFITDAAELARLEDWLRSRATLL